MAGGRRRGWHHDDDHSCDRCNGHNDRDLRRHHELDVHLHHEHEHVNHRAAIHVGTADIEHDGTCDHPSPTQLDHERVAGAGGQAIVNVAPIPQNGAGRICTRRDGGANDSDHRSRPPLDHRTSRPLGRINPGHRHRHRSQDHRRGP